MSRVGLSKGSFYHHFGGMAGYRTALLAHYEAAETTRFITEAEREPAGTPLARLHRLLGLVCDADQGWDVEVALRSWATQDADVRVAQERIDRMRVDYLRALWFELSGDDEQAERMAEVSYLLLVGAGHVLPQVPPSNLKVLYEFVFGLARRERNIATGVAGAGPTPR